MDTPGKRASAAGRGYCPAIDPGTLRLENAQSLTPAALTTLFNDGYRGYSIPLTLDEPALCRHLVHNDIDLAASRVAVIDRPVSLALVGRRGAEAWLGGMGTIPSHRRRGLGGLTLASALDALASAGAATVSLEVLEENEAAIVLYEKLGFSIKRRLMVWRLSSADFPEPAADPRSETRALSVQHAKTWIAEHRQSKEPWQRADASLEKLRDDVGRLESIGLKRSGALVAAVICAHDGSATRVVQLAALDQDAAAETVAAVAASAGGGPVALVNVPEGEALAAALAAARIPPANVQYEMWMSLSAGRAEPTPVPLRRAPPDP